MKKSLTTPVYFLILIILSFFSCNKDEDFRTYDGAGLLANKAPVANAGSNKDIILPTDSVILDGTASKDWDGIISSYTWSKISGPASYLIIDSAAVRTQVRDLIEGTYLFELIVIDDRGLEGRDVVEINVKSALSFGCNGNTRPTINIGLTAIGTLSQPRIPYVAAAGNKIVFGGGPYIEEGSTYYYNSAVVDIYDLTSKTWSTTTLSKEREGMAAIGCGSKIFFAGGGFWEWSFSNVDIYDVTKNTWVRTDLSVPRSYLTTATVGNKVFFAGGFTDGWEASTAVDIYDLTTNTWSGAYLSEPRYNLCAVTVGDKIYFAGGNSNWNSSRVDIYDNSTNSWSTSSLQNLSGFISGVAIDNNIYWSGLDRQNSGTVEIWNTINGSVTSDCLTYPRQAPLAVKNNSDIVFFTSNDWGNEVDFGRNFTNQIDIYNTTTNQWLVGLLPHPVVAPGIISVNNSLYMGGGRTGRTTCTDKVYILNW